MAKTRVKTPKISVKRLQKELGQGGGKISTNWFFKFSIFCISEHALTLLGPAYLSVSKDQGGRGGMSAPPVYFGFGLG